MSKKIEEMSKEELIGHVKGLVKAILQISKMEVGLYNKCEEYKKVIEMFSK